jgi:hypothetical protein
VDGDGRDEVLAMVRFEDEAAPYKDVLYCLSTDGEVRWTYTPKDTLEFDGVTHGPGWVMLDFIVAGEGSARAVYVAVIHHMWWPSMIVRIFPDGRAERLFTQSGGLYSLFWWTGADRPYLVTTGINNEYRGASLAVIDPSAGPAVSPQTPGHGFHCASCGSGRPVRYFVFPPSDVTLAGNFPYNRGSAAGSHGGRLIVYVEEDLANRAAQRLFSFTADLAPQDVAPTDPFWAQHDRLHRQGVLDHASATCPHWLRSTPVRVWSRQTGWQTMEMPPAPSKAGWSDMRR